jgi:hypothetical protein
MMPEFQPLPVKDDYYYGRMQGFKEGLGIAAAVAFPFWLAEGMAGLNWVGQLVGLGLIVAAFVNLARS